MPTEAPSRRMPLVPRPADLEAAEAADRTGRANLAALARRQPGQADALASCRPDLAWALARDGSLSGRDPSGAWWAGCSVPLLAGRALLRTLVVEPGGHGLLAPAHAGLVVAVRERLGPDPVLFVLQPDLACVRRILGSVDLTADLAAGRLWFAAGPAWAVELRRIFDANHGMATPARFVQTRLSSNAESVPLIEEAQRIFSAVATARAAALDGRRRTARPAVPGRVLFVGGTHFRLTSPFDDALREAATAVAEEVLAYDTDDPMTAAPPAFAAAAEGAAAVVAANLGRGDIAAVLPAGTRWITWATRPALPGHAGAGSDDHLILADPTWRERAKAAGWPADRILVGRCPARFPSLPLPATPSIGLICDTGPLRTPEVIRNFSSHERLWDAIAADVMHDPLAVTDPARYVIDRVARAGLAEAELDVALLVNQLIRPAYAQAIARSMIKAGLPVRLWGRGWADLAEFASRAAGAVSSFDELKSAVGASTILARPTPGGDWHPLQATGRTMLHPGPTASDWLRRAATGLRAPCAPEVVSDDRLGTALHNALRPLP